jgi:transposase
MKTYKTWQPTASYLLPPSPRDWLPEDHLVYFLLDVLGQLDLSAVEDAVQAKDARGTRPYAPAMMVLLLLYGYCVGVFSSRKLEKATYEDVAFRVLTGGH